MMRNALMKGHISPKMPYNSKRALSAEEEKQLLSKNPLLWAMTKLDGWIFQPRAPLLSDVVQVAAQSIAAMNNDMLEGFSNSGVLQLLDDFAAVSSMISNLEAQSPPLLEVNWAYFKGESEFAEEWIKKYRTSGSQFYSTLPAWKDVFARGREKGIPPRELIIAGRFLQELHDTHDDGPWESDAPKRLQWFWENMNNQRLAHLRRCNEDIPTIPDGSNPPSVHHAERSWSRMISLPRLKASEIAETQDVKIMQRFGNIVYDFDDCGEDTHSESDPIAEELVEKPPELPRCSCTTRCRTKRCSCYEADLACSDLCHGAKVCSNHKRLGIKSGQRTKAAPKARSAPKGKPPAKAPRETKTTAASSTAPKKSKPATKAQKKKVADSTSKEPKKVKPATASAAERERQERLERRNARRSAK